MSELFIREALPDDLQSVQRLYLELRNADLNGAVPQLRAEQFLGELKRYPGSALLVGVLGDLPVTTCTLVVIPNLTRQATPYALIENVATHIDHRNQGFATQLLRAAAERAFVAGCYKVMLLAGSKDPALIRFYENAGFAQSKTGFQMRNEVAGF